MLWNLAFGSIILIKVFVNTCTKICITVFLNTDAKKSLDTITKTVEKL